MTIKIIPPITAKDGHFVCKNKQILVQSWLEYLADIDKNYIHQEFVHSWLIINYILTIYSTIKLAKNYISTIDKVLQKDILETKIWIDVPNLDLKIKVSMPNIIAKTHQGRELNNIFKILEDIKAIQSIYAIREISDKLNLNSTYSLYNSNQYKKFNDYFNDKIRLLKDDPNYYFLNHDLNQTQINSNQFSSKKYIVLNLNDTKEDFLLDLVHDLYPNQYTFLEKKIIDSKISILPNIKDKDIKESKTNKI